MARVLIIDDDYDFRTMMELKMQRLGHESESGKTLQEGLSKAAEFAPDVVFLDVNMPDGFGPSIIGRLKELPSAPNVVVVTGRATSDSAEIAIRNGAWDFITKGDTINQILLCLKRVLAFREYKNLTNSRVIDPCGIVGSSSAAKTMLDAIATAASSDANVLLTGDTGTGKELFAAAIHQNGSRAKGRMVTVDCAALPENLVESILFGHRKGSFTGATEKQTGLVKQAEGGTLFLDEVAEMPLATQKIFLRVLQEKRFRPIGSDEEVTSDFRLISATNRNLDEMAAKGTFRPDLLHRLKSIEINLPPLKARKQDISDIILDRVARIAKRTGGAIKGISSEFLEAANLYHWPGNVRELINAVESSVANAGDYPTLYSVHLPMEIRIYAARTAFGEHGGPPPVPVSDASTHTIMTFDDFKDFTTRAYLEDLMERCGGEIGIACGKSGMSRAHLYRLLKEHGIHRK